MLFLSLFCFLCSDSPRQPSGTKPTKKQVAEKLSGFGSFCGGKWTDDVLGLGPWGVGSGPFFRLLTLIHFFPQILPDVLDSSNTSFLCTRLQHLQPVVSPVCKLLSYVTLSCHLYDCLLKLPQHCCHLALKSSLAETLIPAFVTFGLFFLLSFCWQPTMYYLQTSGHPRHCVSLVLGLVRSPAPFFLLHHSHTHHIYCNGRQSKIHFTMQTTSVAPWTLFSAINLCRNFSWWRLTGHSK